MQTVDLSTAPELFRGCGVPGRRMSDELLKLFSDNEKLLWRALCPSGVRLDFITDALEMNYALEFGQPVRQIFTSDIFVDGKLQTVDGAGVHNFKFVPGKKHIVIHLPHLVVLEKVALEISDGAMIEAASASEKRLLFCGDSICQGMVTSRPALALVPRVGAALNADYVNTSVGGARMSADHLKFTMAIPGDVIIMALGVNNAIGKTPYDEFKAETERTLAAMNDFPGGKVVVLPIPNVAPSTPDLDVYRNIIREAAAAYPAVKVVDGYDFYPAKAELYYDNTHPNDDGSAVYADFLTDVLKTLL